VAHHAARQAKDLEFIFEVRHTDGSLERFSGEVSLRYFFRYELEHRLARGGFRVERVYCTGTSTAGERQRVGFRGKESLTPCGHFR